ncbi:MAG: hypothetical protein HOV94_21760 [Saccharothrix sp.]|nr:hypothetical protein [Saccharothrix sp.]
MSEDLVVVVSGILGSTLTHHGTAVWEPSAGAVLRAIGTLGRSLHRLRLPDGIGDDHPDDGVRPVTLMPDIHIVPGLWTPIHGYTVLLHRLNRLGHHQERGNLLPFAYDWRLSNRHNALRLARTVEPALERWRAGAPHRRDARVVFVCHSMGGLLTRWYVEKLGGAEITRRLVTLGTPYRGAVKALAQLVNGPAPLLGRLADDLTLFARSLPSLHQLLPTYACLTGPHGLTTLAETTVPELDTRMIADAAAFHRDLADAEAARPAGLDTTHAIIGTRQNTPTTAHLTGNAVTTLDTIDGDNDHGDATVPLTGSIGHDLPQDTNRVHRVTDHHGNLQSNRHTLDRIEEIITSTTIRRRNPDDLRHLSLDIPELHRHNTPLTLTVHTPPDLRQAITVTVTDEHGAIVWQRQPTPRDHRITTTIPRDTLRPGAHTIRAHGGHATSPVTPVTAHTLIWSDTTPQ